MNTFTRKKIIEQLFRQKLTDKYMIDSFTKEVESYLRHITREDCIKTLQKVTGSKDFKNYSNIKIACVICGEDIYNNKFIDGHEKCDYDRCCIEYTHTIDNTKTHIIGYPIIKADYKLKMKKT